jgi:hypothetical protein
LDRVEEIKRHEAIADREDSRTSEHRWEAARLIWEEITEAGTSRRALADQIGKSHTHVRYMFNCWDIVGRKLVVSGGSGSLPNFNTVYTSEEIRESHDENIDEHGAKARRGRYSDGDQSPSYAAHDLVVQAVNAIDSLTRNPPYWPLLTDDDMDLLRGLPAASRALLKDIAASNRRR